MDGDEFDQGYVNLREGDYPTSKMIKEELSKLWRKFEPYADGNFREEFARNPDARFWEMFLCVSLLDAGKQIVERKDRCEEGPDFLVHDGHTKIWIEAVTFGPGAEGRQDSVPEFSFDGTAQQVPVNQIELRISGAFAEKRKKFAGYLKQGLISPDDLCLVAISPGRLSWLCNDHGRGSPLTVLYPIGDQYVTFFKDSDATESGYNARLDIEKTSGSKVPIGYLADETQKQIAGVIWSRTGISNFFEGGRGFHYFPNVVAENSLNEGWMDWDCEWKVTAIENGNVTMKRFYREETDD